MPTRPRLLLLLVAIYNEQQDGSTSPKFSAISLLSRPRTKQENNLHGIQIPNHMIAHRSVGVLHCFEAARSEHPIKLQCSMHIVDMSLLELLLLEGTKAQEGTGRKDSPSEEARGDLAKHTTGSFFLQAISGSKSSVLREAVSCVSGRLLDTYDGLWFG